MTAVSCSSQDAVSLGNDGGVCARDGTVLSCVKIIRTELLHKVVITFNRDFMVFDILCLQTVMKKVQNHVEQCFIAVSLL